MQRVVVVTGASRGIGRAIAIELACRGYRVVVNYRTREADAQKVVEAIREGDGEAMAIKADVACREDVEAMAYMVREHFGPVDALVNNAGITRDDLLLRMKEEEWDEVMGVNLKSTYLCSKVFLRDMVKKRWGRIINISSVVALVGNPGQSNYAASKAGMIGFTKALAKEVASRNITVNAVAPGYIKTEMTSILPNEVRDQMLSAIPLARFGLPSEVAHLVSFLTSNDAGYITGQIFVIDGGMTL